MSKKEERTPIGYKPTIEKEEPVVDPKFISNNKFFKRLYIAIKNPITYIFGGYTEY